jgi:putative nucleotidyltransferase with HDIG domain
MNKLAADPQLLSIAERFAAAGKSVYLVGGAVRDMLRGVQAKDWDLATDATPQEVMAMFRRVVPTGIKHGTVTIVDRGRAIETTTFRADSGYSDGRHPDAVEFGVTIEADLARRDFTMNAIALALPSGDLVDPYGGEADLKRRVIRCVGDPRQRFAEDALRLLRAVRFVAQLEFELDPAAAAAIPEAAPRLDLVAAERVRDELLKLLASRRPSLGLRLMEETGLLARLLPELAAGRGVEQKGFHVFDVLDHGFAACDAAPADDPGLRLAALLHDIGKPSVRRLDPSGVWTFHRHEEESARLARAILLRLKLPHAVTDRIVHLVMQHMFHYEEDWSDAAVRRFVLRVGETVLPDLYALRRADLTGTLGREAPFDCCAPLANRVETVLALGKAFSLNDLVIGGEDLAGLGIGRGPMMGRILKQLLETVLDDPAQNNRERLLAIAAALAERLSAS